MMAKLIYENKLTHSDLSTSRLRKLYSVCNSIEEFPCRLLDGSPHSSKLGEIITISTKDSLQQKENGSLKLRLKRLCNSLPREGSILKHIDTASSNINLQDIRNNYLTEESFNHKYNTAVKIMNSNYSSTDDTSLTNKNITLRESRLHQDDDVMVKVNKFSNLKTTSSERAISQHICNNSSKYVSALRTRQSNCKNCLSEDTFIKSVPLEDIPLQLRIKHGLTQNYMLRNSCKQTSDLNSIHINSNKSNCISNKLRSQNRLLCGDKSTNGIISLESDEGCSSKKSTLQDNCYNTLNSEDVSLKSLSQYTCNNNNNNSNTINTRLKSNLQNISSDYSAQEPSLNNKDCAQTYNSLLSCKTIVPVWTNISTSKSRVSERAVDHFTRNRVRRFARNSVGISPSPGNVAQNTILKCVRFEEKLEEIDSENELLSNLISRNGILNTNSSNPLKSLLEFPNDSPPMLGSCPSNDFIVKDNLTEQSHVVLRKRSPKKDSTVNHKYESRKTSNFENRINETILENRDKNLFSQDASKDIALDVKPKSTKICMSIELAQFRKTGHKSLIKNFKGIPKNTLIDLVDSKGNLAKTSIEKSPDSTNFSHNNSMDLMDHKRTTSTFIDSKNIIGNDKFIKPSYPVTLKPKYSNSACSNMFSNSATYIPPKDLAPTCRKCYVKISHMEKEMADSFHLPLPQLRSTTNTLKRKACDYLIGEPKSKRTCLSKYDVTSVSEEQSYVYLKHIDNVMLQDNKNTNKTLRIRPHQSYDFGQKLNKGYLHLNKSNPNTSLHQSPHVGWPSTHSMSRYNSPTARSRRLSSAPQRYNPASYSSIKSSRGSTISHHSRHNPNSSKMQKPQKCFSPQTNRADFLFSIGLQSSVPQIVTAIVPPGTAPTDDHWRTLAPSDIPKLDISAEKLFKIAGRLKVKLSEPSSSSKCWYRTGHLILSLLSNYSGLQDTQKRQLAHCTKQLLSDVEHGRSCAFANQFPSWLLFSPSLEKQRSKVRRKKCS